MAFLLPSAIPPTIEIEGDDHAIEVASDVAITTRVIVRGRGNRLIISPGVTIAAFAPAGFAATVPDASAGGPHTIVIEGEGNTIVLGAGTRLGVNLVIRGDNNHVAIGEACHLHGFINVLCSNARLSVGARTTMVQGSIQLHEAGEIFVGDDCMISSQVYISLSDIHPIYDRATGQRINPPAPIHVGNHVWAGLRCMILKGAQIGDGTVIAAGSIVSGEAPANTIIAGAPARILREGVTWRRDFSETIEPSPVQPSAPYRSSWRRLFAFSRFDR